MLQIPKSGEKFERLARGPYYFLLGLYQFRRARAGCKVFQDKFLRTIVLDVEGQISSDKFFGTVCADVS
jgi:hypothetical protein